MKKTLTMGIVLVLLLACVGAVSAVNLVQNPGFEKQSGDIFEITGTGLTDWNVDAGNIDLLSSSYWAPNSGSQSIDLSGLVRGTISQQIATTPGEMYTLTFAMAGNPYQPDNPNDKIVKVYWNGIDKGTYTFNTGGHSESAMGWITIGPITGLEASSGVTTDLKFEDLSEGDQRVGVTLDDVDVEKQTVPPVPEFPTMALPAALIVGLLGAVLFIQKSKED